MKMKMVKLSIPAVLLICSSYLQANTIKEVVEHTIANNPKIMSTLKNNDGYRLYIDEANSEYLPKLDLTAYVEANKTKQSPDIGSKTDFSRNGFNGQLDLEQLIFDGGFTGGVVEESKFRYTANKYSNDSIVGEIIYNSVDSYLNLIKYNNRLAISQQGLDIYENYLLRANENEEINGEALQKRQVNAKIHYAKNLFIQDTTNKLRAESSFIKNVGMPSDGKYCRPVIKNGQVPSSLKSLIDEVIKKNPLILGQVESIKKQRAILNQKDANFYPTIKFKAQAIYDNDLLSEDEKRQNYSARIELVYNIFNGNRDKKSSVKEKIFLNQEQNKLDTIISEVVDETTASYNSYVHSKKRVTELKLYIQDNQEILSIYKDQFESGTRTFIDVLNIERDLISAKQDLVDAEYDLDSSYYQVFNKLGEIEESVLHTNNICTNTKPVIIEKIEDVNNISNEVKDLLLDEKSNMTIDSSTDTTPIEAPLNITGTYALYIVAFRNIESSKKSLQKVEELINNAYDVKLEPARGFHSVVIYNIPTNNELKTVQSKIDSYFPGSYMRKFNK